MNLTRLPYYEHPRPPQRDLRQRVVFDSEGRLIGHVANIYVDDERTIQFVEVAMRSGVLGFGNKNRLVPVEAIAGEEPGTSIILEVDQQTLESAPTLDDPHAVSDEALQHAVREHCGFPTSRSER